MVERILEENIATESGNGGSSYDNSNSIDNINNNIDTTVAECNDGGNSIIASNANEPEKNNCNQLAATHWIFFITAGTMARPWAEDRGYEELQPNLHRNVRLGQRSAITVQFPSLTID
uniref:Uncharacterized protein n=1 Tax=Glossina austeni TaxID=7395 RepID=A0A1A9UZZ6_GLOAU